MSPWEPAANLDGPNRMGRRHRPHRHDRRTMKHARRPAGDVRLVHGYVATRLEMPDRQAGLKQSIFECEGAADEKADQIAAPKAVQIVRLVHKFAVAIGPV